MNRTSTACKLHRTVSLFGRSALSALVLASVALLFASPAHAQITTIDSNDANALADHFLDPNSGIVRVGDAVLIGLDFGEGAQQGFFTDPGNNLLFGGEGGIVLSTGFAHHATGPNTSTSNTKSWGSDGRGDADLESLLQQGRTHDANILEFDFRVPSNATRLQFQYVFASDEYNEFVDRAFNDVFGFFVDGENVARLSDGTPVTINTVNKNVNSAFFRDNDVFQNTPTIDTAMDGLTTMLLANAMAALDPNREVHHIKLAIADVQDSAIDSLVFLKHGSFRAGDAQVPEPGTGALLLGMGLSALVFLRRRKWGKRNTRAKAAKPARDGQ